MLLKVLVWFPADKSFSYLRGNLHIDKWAGLYLYSTQPADL